MPTDGAGALRVDATLRSIADPTVFGAGDCIAFEGRALPHIGVHAVKQAPVLLHNLLAALDGRPPRRYRPQRRALLILNLGDGTGLATWGRLAWRGRAAFWVKDRIDRRWLERARLASSSGDVRIAAAMAIEEGKTAPAFTLTDADGKKVSLEGLRRQERDPLLLSEGRHARAAPRRRAASATTGRQLQKANAVVLGVSADGEASHQKFRAKYKLPFPLLSDPDRKVMEKYGAYGEKMMYGKKTVGVIRSTVWIGPDGKVKKHWARVAKRRGASGAGAGSAAGGRLTPRRTRHSGTSRQVSGCGK